MFCSSTSSAARLREIDDRMYPPHSPVHWYEHIYRSSDQYRALGLCAGLAARYSADVRFIRFAVALAIIMSSGGALVLYLLSILLPALPSADIALLGRLGGGLPGRGEKPGDEAANAANGARARLDGLDRAYQEKLFERGEYESRRRRLMAELQHRRQLDALEFALETGVVSRAEYEAKRRAILGTAA